VLSVLADEFRDSQQGTLHFQYLRRDGGGCVLEAATLEEHLSQLSDVLAGAAPDSRGFVRSFVRPHGLEEPATPRVAAAIEEAAALRPARAAAEGVLLRPFVWAGGMAVELSAPGQRRHILAVLRKRVARPAQKRAHRALVAVVGRVKGTTRTTEDTP
jgi:hypothetical protein